MHPTANIPNDINFAQKPWHNEAIQENTLIFIMQNAKCALKYLVYLNGDVSWLLMM